MSYKFVEFFHGSQHCLLVIILTCMLGTHPLRVSLGVRGSPAAEGCQGPSVKVFEALVQRSSIIKVSAGPLTGRVFRASVAALLRHRERRKGGADLGGPKVRVLDQLADSLHPEVLDIQVVCLQDDLQRHANDLVKMISNPGR